MVSVGRVQDCRESTQPPPGRRPNSGPKESTLPDPKAGECATHDHLPQVNIPHRAQKDHVSACKMHAKPRPPHLHNSVQYGAKPNPRDPARPNRLC
ncbi:hypothetical protein GOODEAATRI_006277 [Goodea atripinnis]|uniref:Uncharacterized protein n=1 Tax=Goodea atripinnis TaxID=208336 RepID=A0ABV0PBW3_9TELE